MGYKIFVRSPVMLGGVTYRSGDEFRYEGELTPEMEKWRGAGVITAVEAMSDIAVAVVTEEVPEAEDEEIIDEELES